MKNVNDFIEQVKTDSSLLNELSGVLAKNDRDAAITFFKSKGIEDADMSNLIDQDDTVAATDELSDEALAEVSAGGFNWCNGIKSLIDSV